MPNLFIETSPLESKFSRYITFVVGLACKGRHGGKWRIHAETHVRTRIQDENEFTILVVLGHIDFRRKHERRNILKHDRKFP